MYRHVRGGLVDCSMRKRSLSLLRSASPTCPSSSTARTAADYTLYYTHSRVLENKTRLKPVQRTIANSLLPSSLSSLLLESPPSLTSTVTAVAPAATSSFPPSSVLTQGRRLPSPTRSPRPAAATKLNSRRNMHSHSQPSPALSAPMSKTKSLKHVDLSALPLPTKPRNLFDVKNARRYTVIHHMHPYSVCVSHVHRTHTPPRHT